MYAIAIIRYRKPLEQVLAAQDDHRAYLRSLKASGILLVSGPMDPRSGGILVLRLPDGASDEDLNRIRDEDPFTRLGLAQYELVRWVPVIGKEDLDRL